MKPKRCKACGAEFIPRASFAVACSYPCSIQHVRNKEAKKAQREAAKAKREGRIRLMNKRDWIKRAQAAVNAYVRSRDAHLPCVSCGRFHDGQWHAGHYRTTKAAPELRFNPLNIWKQCAPCNNHLSGNITPYRAELIKRIGLEKVEWLEGPHPPAKYTIEELQEIEQTYKSKLRYLKAKSFD